MSQEILIGTVIDVTITKIKPYGAIVTLPNKSNGLIHISHISNNYVENISEYLSIGDIVKAKIISIDEATNKISLSIKEANKIPPSPKNSNNNNNNNNNNNFENIFKDWLKSSNERHAGLNRRNKRR